MGRLTAYKPYNHKFTTIINHIFYSKALLIVEGEGGRVSIQDCLSIGLHDKLCLSYIDDAKSQQAAILGRSFEISESISF